MSTKVWGAFAVGFALLLAAYTFSDFGSPRAAVPDSAVNVVVSKAPERTYIKSTDSNEDGIPDWQEALQTSVLNLTNQATSTYEEPETLTDKFALEFFQRYMRGKGYGGFDITPEELINKASSNLQEQAVDKIYTNKDMRILSTDTKQVLHSYGNHISSILIKHSVPADTMNEVDILEKAIAQNDEAFLDKLDVSINAYEKIVRDMLDTGVPKSILKEHLDLTNSYNAVYNDIKAMKLAFSDPIFSLLRVKRYQDDTAGLYTAVVNIKEKIIKAGVTYGPTDPAYQFAN